ncbi:MAG: extracellular solute-binding protein [Acetatifactor sp.]|nr:extracellular solute-binding protein [Acetatifactor sp.]
MNKRRMGKEATALVLAAALTLGGCLGRDAGDPNATGQTAQTGSSDVVFLEDEGGTWNDNFLDDLHAVVNLPVEWVTDEEALDGGTKQFFLGEGGAVLFQNHLYEDYGKDWSGVSGVTPEGERFSLRLGSDSDGSGTRYDAMGPISGKKGYAACRCAFQDGKPSEYWFCELDGNFREVSCVQARGEFGEVFKYVTGDADGNFHVAFHRSDGRGAYAVVSPKGETIFEADLGNGPLGYAPEPCAFGGGRVAVCGLTYENGTVTDRRFYEADLEGGKLREMTVSGEEAVRSQMKKFTYAATPVSDEKLAWCDPTGIFVYDVRTGEATAVYRWSSHGIAPKDVSAMTVTEDGSVGMIYDLKSGRNFLFLSPTEKKEELPSITIAASPYRRSAYEAAATYFKEKHPGYVIIVKDDYDATTLLTQLGAGDGPVLIDTSLTGFEELEGLWQPLDAFLEQTGLREEMIPKARDFGKIGGVTYGIVTEFRVETLTARDSAPDDWDYEGFLDALEKLNGAAYTYESLETPVDWRDLFLNDLQNGLEDNYYFDAETGKGIFGTPEFERVLRLSGKAEKCLPPENGEAMREGRVLCERITLTHPAAAFRLRRSLEANGEKVAGYPTKNGARNLLVAAAPLAMRSTATEEEKQIAYTFLRMILSEESMNATGGQFPVRKDALESLIGEYERTAESIKADGAFNANYMPVLERDKDLPFLYGLIENGVIAKSFPSGLQEVFDEEFGDYLAGRIDGRALDEHLKSRVWLYLEESK